MSSNSVRGGFPSPRQSRPTCSRSSGTACGPSRPGRRRRPSRSRVGGPTRCSWHSSPEPDPWLGRSFPDLVADPERMWVGTLPDEPQKHSPDTWMRSLTSLTGTSPHISRYVFKSSLVQSTSGDTQTMEPRRSDAALVLAAATRVELRSRKSIESRSLRQTCSTKSEPRHRGCECSPGSGSRPCGRRPALEGLATGREPCPQRRPGCRTRSS